MSGLGLPDPITLRAGGVTALREPRGRIRMDLGPLLARAGAPSKGKGELEMIIDGADVHIRPPEIDDLSIPGGKSWVALDLRAIADAAGLPTKGLGALFTLDPASQLRAVKSTKGLDDVGEQEIGGVQTTLRDFGTKLDTNAPPPSQTYDATKALSGALKRLTPGSK